MRTTILIALLGCAQALPIPSSLQVQSIFDPINEPGVPNHYAIQPLTVEKLAEAYQSVRNVRGHFEGGAWNDAVDSFNGAKHQIMVSLQKEFLVKGRQAWLVRKYMGEPDVVRHYIDTDGEVVDDEDSLLSGMGGVCQSPSAKDLLNDQDKDDNVKVQEQLPGHIRKPPPYNDDFGTLSAHKSEPIYRIQNTHKSEPIYRIQNTHKSEPIYRIQNSHKSEPIYRIQGEENASFGVASHEDGAVHAVSHEEGAVHLGKRHTHKSEPVYTIQCGNSWFELYFWRGFHDYMWVYMENGVVAKTGWYHALE